MSTSELGTSSLRLERDCPIAWCVIDRPHARNAPTRAMYFGIKRAVQRPQINPPLKFSEGRGQQPILLLGTASANLMADRK